MRSFKHVDDDAIKQNRATTDVEEGDQMHSGRAKTNLELTLERPLVKEASIQYVLRKAAELQIDLRKEFVSNDPLELSVLPRVKFWNIVINLPLGLNESELKEIFENDLYFDNYGNVDYTQILNMDMFVTLEAKRIRENVMQRSRELRKGTLGDGAIDQLADEKPLDL